PSTQEQSTASFTVNIDRGFIDGLEGFFKAPIYIYMTIAAVLIAITLGGYGIFKFKQHLEWKRTLKKVRSAGAEREPAPSEETSDEEVEFEMEGGAQH
ncbi:MAG: hypothetical protein R6V01_05980, partial [Thermoplasmatota archaeon]